MQKISAENISSIHATWASLRYGHPVAMGDSPPSEPEAPAETGPEISEATERPQLLRKVAQLTKVVMHLTAKNTQSEEQYEEMEKELEEEVSLGLFESAVVFATRKKRVSVFSGRGGMLLFKIGTGDCFSSLVYILFCSVAFEPALCNFPAYR